MTKPLFMVGNKRSGTSQLVRLLNLHPRVFIAHESDLVWILYQFHHQMEWQPHPWDSGRGMDVTLASCAGCLHPERTPRENYFVMQQRIMETGNPWMGASNKKAVLWSGDKKPFQHTDPRLVDFIAEHLADASFIHIVRHPFAVALSSERFNYTPQGDFWQGLSREDKVARWTFHEELVEQVKIRFPARVHTLRYEDLCAEPRNQLQRLLAFLELEAPREMLAQAELFTRLYKHRLPAIRSGEATRQMAARHGYDLTVPGAPVMAMVLDNLRWRWRHWMQQ